MEIIDSTGNSVVKYNYIPFVGWALAIGATALVEFFDEEIEEFKDWFAEGWNEFWSFSWL